MPRIRVCALDATTGLCFRPATISANMTRELGNFKQYSGWCLSSWDPCWKLAKKKVVCDRGAVWFLLISSRSDVRLSHDLKARIRRLDSFRSWSWKRETIGFYWNHEPSQFPPQMCEAPPGERLTTSVPPVIDSTSVVPYANKQTPSPAARIGAVYRVRVDMKRLKEPYWQIKV